MGDFCMKKEAESSGFSTDDYLASINGPTSSESLQHLFDYGDGSVIAEYLNFDAEGTMERLTRLAALQKTTPKAFAHDMKDLVSQRNKELPPLPKSERYDRPYEERRLWNLRNKYCFEYSSNGATNVTPIRLSILFPHYCDIHQVPLYSLELSPDRILFMCQHPEFGGFIPNLPRKEFPPDVKKAIIVVHLFSLVHSGCKFPLRTHCVLLKQRMLKSQLSNERRLLFLENNNIITRRKTITPTMRDALEQIDAESFQGDIYWDLIKV